MTSATSRQTRITLLGLFALALGLYLQGLHGGFLFDDFVNIVDNEAIRQFDGSLTRLSLAAFSSDSGPLGRPLSMASFAVNFYFTGMNPAGFKLINILIHLVSGVLAYRLALLLIPTLITAQSTRITPAHARLLALFAAGAWLLHPLHVSNVLYVVQRMNLLAVLFLFAALLCYAHARQRLIEGLHGWALPISGFFGFGLLAVFSKENGVLLPLLAFVIELFCFRFVAADRRIFLALKSFYTLALLLPTLVGITYLLIHPEWLHSGYALRDFDLAQRLLTQCRVLWHYLLWTFVPNPHWMGLYHDDIPLSAMLFKPSTTLPALLGLAGLIALTWRCRRSHPGISFGIAWFFAGHALESTVIPLEMVFEHRQYLPMLGLFIGAASCFSTGVMNRPLLAGSLALLLIGALATATAQRCHTWGEPLRLAMTTASDHPQSARSQYDAGRILVDGRKGDANIKEGLEQARPYFSRAMRLDSSYVHPVSSLLMTYQQQPQVPPELVLELAQRLRGAPRLSPLPLILLIKTAAAGQLALKQDDVRLLVNAALENKSLTRFVHGLLLTNYGNYLYEATDDHQEAINVTLAAVGLEPRSPLFQLNAAFLAQRLGEATLAQRHLEIANAMDTGRTYTTEILDLRKKITTMRAPAISNP